MKSLKRLICVILSVMLIFTGLLPVGATSAEEAPAEENAEVSTDTTAETDEAVSEEADLEGQWLDTKEATRGITVQPGRNDSERNFSWYMSAGTDYCAVEISRNEDMKDAETFTGTAIDTWQGDKSAKVTVTGLEYSSTYYYTCVSGTEKSDVYSFTTPDEDSFSALYVTDIHIAESEDYNNGLKNTSFAFAQLLEAAARKSDYDIILTGGDLATEGLRVEYEGLSFSDISRSRTMALSLGNHDRHSFDYKYFKNLPNERFGPMSGYQSGNYYFVKGDALFLFIDTNNASASAHRSLIKEAVSENPDVKWRIVIMHHDIYAGSLPHRESENKLFRILFSPIFDEFDIDMVLAGHSHHYSVSDIIYNSESVEKIESGKTYENAAGTVYFVGTSVIRPEEEAEEITYSDRVSIGMENSTDRLYNILDCSEDELKLTTYRQTDDGEDEEFMSFTLTKTEDYKPAKIGFFRKIGGILAGWLSTVYGIYVNADRYFDLKEDGYKAPFFEFVF